jgi:hypothetical protein
MVSRLAESVAVPKDLLRELHEELIGIEEVLATLEELMDKEGLRRIRRAEEEYKGGKYVTAERSSEVEKLIK